MLIRTPGDWSPDSVTRRSTHEDLEPVRRRHHRATRVVPEIAVVRPGVRAVRDQRRFRRRGGRRSPGRLIATGEYGIVGAGGALDVGHPGARVPCGTVSRAASRGTKVLRHEDRGAHDDRQREGGTADEGAPAAAPGVRPRDDLDRVVARDAVALRLVGEHLAEQLRPRSCWSCHHTSVGPRSRCRGAAWPCASWAWRLHAPGRAAEDVGDLLLGEVLVVAQHDDGALPRRQGDDQGPHLLVVDHGLLAQSSTGRVGRRALAGPRARPAGRRRAGDEGVDHEPSHVRVRRVGARSRATTAGRPSPGSPGRGPRPRTAEPVSRQASRNRLVPRAATKAAKSSSAPIAPPRCPHP